MHAHSLFFAKTFPFVCIRIDIAKLRRERGDADQALTQLQEREATLARQVEEAEGQRHRATSRRTEMEVRARGWAQQDVHRG